MSDLPRPENFPPFPRTWAVACASRDLRRDPVGVDLFGRRLVLYRAADGGAVALGGRCWHLGADLAGGCVVGDQIACPFHGWRFGPDGRCAHVPAQPDDVPREARQPTFAVEERAGRVFVFPAASADYPLPWFESATPRELVAARPFTLRPRCPWWLVGANAFDLQHFAGAHDRRLVGEPTLSHPHPGALRVAARFEVVGDSLDDRLIRRVSGPRVAMHVTVWAGGLAFVEARFEAENGRPRTTTFGLTEIRPDAGGAIVRVTIFARRRRVVGRLDANVRARFVRRFLLPDARLLDGATYRPDRLIAADRFMADYFRWLAETGTTAATPETTL